MPIILCLVYIGAVFLQSISSKNPLELLFGKTAQLSGEVANTPAFKKKDYRIVVQSDYGAVYVMLPDNNGIKRGDRITVKGELSEGFGSYIAFMHRPNLLLVEYPTTNDLALTLRDNLSSRIDRQVENEDEKALSLSYLLGQKELLSEELQEKLRLAGLAHVVVASGFHLAIVVSFAKRYFAKLSRFATLAGALILMFCYIAVTGFSPSMMRAGAATALSIFAWYFGRRFHPLRLIIYLMAITLFIDPTNLSNIAWQLSFASYSGILILCPLITKFFYGKRQPNMFITIIIASLSAQIFCLPVTIFHFGAISLLAVLSNLLVSPTIALVMLLAFLAAVTNWSFLGFLMAALARFHLTAVDFITNIEWCSFELPAKQPFILLLYVPILIMVFIFKLLSKHDFRPRYDKIYA